MKELIFRHYFNDFKNTNQIAESLAPIINETFDKKISDLISINFEDLLIITKEENDKEKAIIKFDYEDYNSPVELSLHIMMTFHSISTGEIKIPKDTFVGIDLVKRESN
jgi:hypothetical protein